MYFRCILNWMAYKRHMRQYERRVLKRIATHAASKAHERMERIFKAQEQQQEYDAIRLMILEEAATRRTNYLMDAMDFIYMEIVYGSIIEEALQRLDRKQQEEEERIVAERRMREEQKRAHYELCQFMDFNIIRRYMHMHACIHGDGLCTMRESIDDVYEGEYR